MPSISENIIAIDLGSNTFRAISYDCVGQKWGADFERIVKTADGMHLTGQVSSAAIERIIAAAEDAKKVIAFEHSEVVAVTTAAMRMAKNRDEALERIRVKSGISFSVIDDAKEAFYTMLAVRNRLTLLEMAVGDFVLIDIGGASTEVMFYREGVFRSESFHIGIVTIAQQCSSAEEVRAMIKEALKPVGTYIEKEYASFGRPGLLVATAGTPTTIAAFLQGMTYATYDPHKINGQCLTLEQCEEALLALMALDDETRAEYVGVGKETLIMAGVIIVEEFYKTLGFTEAIIIDDGLREGVAIDHCSRVD